MNKTTKKLVTASTFLFTGMYAVNKYINTHIPPVISSVHEKKFIWNDTEIIYSEKGEKNNPPLLLLHNLYPSSSKEEWSFIDNTLAKRYHIYELDLPGCGKSDKPNETYINYMFVQLLSKFVIDVIGTKVTVCASAFSSSFTIMAARLNPDIFEKLIMINPTSIDHLVKPITKKSEFIKQMINLPVIGTFIYNCKMCKSAIADDYKYLYFYNDKNVSENQIDLSYNNAHLKNSNGRFLLGSIIGNYTNINILHALPKIENEIYLIGSVNYKPIIQEYKKYNENIHAIYVSNCGMLPHLEIPETIIDKINTICYDNFK